MPEEKWYQDPEKATRAAVFAILLAGGALTWWLAGDQVNTMFALAVSGDVDGLAEYFRSFGAWAIVVSFVLDVLINAGSVFQRVPFNFYFHSQRADFRAACGYFNLVAGRNDGRCY